MPLSSDHKTSTVDLALTPWLQDGSRYTPTLPDLARAIVERKPMRVLDAGCGSGELLRALLAVGMFPAQLFGCDIEPDHAELARRRTALPGWQIAHASLTDGNPFTGEQFDVVACINWLHDDWRANNAVKAARAEPDPKRLERVIDVLTHAVLPGGVLCWDWHAPKGHHRFMQLLDRADWRMVRLLSFPEDRIRYPETYPIYFHARQV